MYSPPFRTLTEEEDKAVIERINETKPDFVWIGLGAPKQEKWMADGKGMSSALKKYCMPYRFPKKMYMTWFALNHMYLIPKPLLSVRKKLRGGG